MQHDELPKHSQQPYSIHHHQVPCHHFALQTNKRWTNWPTFSTRQQQQDRSALLHPHLHHNSASHRHAMLHLRGCRCTHPPMHHLRGCPPTIQWPHHAGPHPTTLPAACPYPECVQPNPLSIQSEHRNPRLRNLPLLPSMSHPTDILPDQDNRSTQCPSKRCIIRPLIPKNNLPLPTSSRTTPSPAHPSCTI